MHGRDEHGAPLHLEPQIKAGCARALWHGLSLPSGAAAGDVLEVTLHLTLAPATSPPAALAGARTTTVVSTARLKFAGERVDDLGDAQRWRLSRLTLTLALALTLTLTETRTRTRTRT